METSYDFHNPSHEIEDLHKTVAGGFAALIAAGAVNSNPDYGYDTLFAYAEDFNIAKVVWKGRDKAAGEESAEAQS